jgi:hypothetical protein
MEKGTAHPDEDDSEVSEVSRKNLAACFFKITYMGVKVVSVSVEIPNPCCGFGSFGEASGPEAGISGFFQISWDMIPVDWLVVRSGYS